MFWIVTLWQFNSVFNLASIKFYCSLNLSLYIVWWYLDLPKGSLLFHNWNYRIHSLINPNSHLLFSIYAFSECMSVMKYMEPIIYLPNFLDISLLFLRTFPSLLLYLILFFNYIFFSFSFYILNFVETKVCSLKFNLPHKVCFSRTRSLNIFTCWNIFT